MISCNAVWYTDINTLHQNYLIKFLLFPNISSPHASIFNILVIDSATLNFHFD